MEHIYYEKFSKSYCTISRLGHGSFGCAVLAKCRKDVDAMLDISDDKKGTMLESLESKGPARLYKNGLVAVKIMKTQLRLPEEYLKVNEVKFILSVSSHQNLLQILDLFVDHYTGKLHIVMEPMNENLYQLIQRHEAHTISPKAVKSMLTQLLNAIRHIHSFGFFHRDVKPENILISSSLDYYGSREAIPPEHRSHSYILKLCDYGLSRHVNNDKELTPYVSTRWYRAPEILLRLKSYAQPIDVWAFACVAIELVNSRPLLCGQNESEQIWLLLNLLGHPLYQSRKHDSLGGFWSEGVKLANALGFTMPYMAGASIGSVIEPGAYTELGRVLQLCLSWDPAKRPTSEQIAMSAFFQDDIEMTTVVHLPTPVSPVIASDSGSLQLFSWIQPSDHHLDEHDTAENFLLQYITFESAGNSLRSLVQELSISSSIALT